MLLQKGLAFPCHWSVTESAEHKNGPGFSPRIPRGLGSAATIAALFTPGETGEYHFQLIKFSRSDRRHFIGGSDARIIMGNDEADLIRLWREKRGESEPEDLSGNLIVQLGTATEELNRSWYQRNSGQTVKDIQRRVRHPVHSWMAATLDGIVEQTGAVFEAKFMLPWAFTEEGAADKHMARRTGRSGHPLGGRAMTMRSARR
ncbi:hypothetical protein ABIF38_007527 [Bradyrhizobium japonicum]|nr:hypothetical protein [Bradyrhizobium elkanii]MCS3574288.1 hypothetical protein [Bradyrhizobium elkanii]MCS3622466.1 hypothetical protein [Bradyrhizobium elkanii]MCW2109068.1 hypothetical protein [Bradyrhizobium elkanii]MCW2202454.1 hypothetical protein [Bradyrhizobium elkanii]